ncbi:abasic site processing protein HMCES-like [Oncorhynchus clarkii lewisi]|uniref:abasic site processing protein HMCES-like n=1 Tax=Oncorhynchus clarkii lewisi TaxID=490388 RepID=UPI0039B86F48
MTGCQRFSTEVRSWLDFDEEKSLDALKLLQSKKQTDFSPSLFTGQQLSKTIPECLLPVDPQAKKEPKPSAGSKMMMGWLKSSTPSKRKEPDTGEVKQEGHTGETRPEKQPKTAGPLQQWLQGPS